MDKTALVRLVAVREATTSVVTPDLHGSLPGRGAHLHPTTRCLELATRRKAFGRAFRTEGPYDLTVLATVVQDQDQPHGPSGP